MCSHSFFICNLFIEELCYFPSLLPERAPEQVLRDLTCDILESFHPLHAEVAKQLGMLPAVRDEIADHGMMETVFVRLLALPSAPHLWIYYANVLADILEKTMPSLAPTLLEVCMCNLCTLYMFIIRFV